MTPLATHLPLRILLAEDAAINQKFALLALEQFGYRADLAANGREVLEALARQAYDVILMDVQMPEMDGLEATRRIGQLWSGAAAHVPDSPRPRIIAMTANTLPGDREACLAAGMDDYISKPIYLHELRSALERARPDPSPPAAPAEQPTPLWVNPTLLADVITSASGPEIIKVYLEETQALLTTLRAAVETGAAPKVAAAAHTLKSTSGYMGAQPMADLCALLEEQGRGGSLAPEATAWLAQLETAFQYTRRALDTALGIR
jgi:CheY-like chemotaxis protein/HPt (histidine-containing phosphotransfer) domain-containing protein